MKLKARFVVCNVARIRNPRELLMKRYRVELVNVQTIGARCGYGEGETLEDAQREAMRRLTDEQRRTASLSSCGYMVRFEGGINC